MRLIIGSFLIIVSFLAAFWFRKYNGTLIPYPILLFLACVVIGGGGIWLVYSSLKRSIRRESDQHLAQRLKFKATAEKMKVQFDFCEFKDASYFEEVRDERLGLISLASPASLAQKDTAIQRKNKSSLIYRPPQQQEEFVSGSFHLDATTLKTYVLQDRLFLFVDRFDRTKYFFEMQG